MITVVRSSSEKHISLVAIHSRVKLFVFMTGYKSSYKCVCVYGYCCFIHLLNN